MDVKRDTGGPTVAEFPYLKDQDVVEVQRGPEPRFDDRLIFVAGFHVDPPVSIYPFVSARGSNLHQNRAAKGSDERVRFDLTPI